MLQQENKALKQRAEVLENMLVDVDKQVRLGRAGIGTCFVRMRVCYGLCACLLVHVCTWALRACTSLHELAWMRMPTACLCMCVHVCVPARAWGSVCALLRHERAALWLILCNWSHPCCNVMQLELMSAVDRPGSADWLQLMRLGHSKVGVLKQKWLAAPAGM